MRYKWNIRDRNNQDMQKQIITSTMENIRSRKTTQENISRNC